MTSVAVWTCGCEDPLCSARGVVVVQEFEHTTDGHHLERDLMVLSPDQARSVAQHLLRVAMEVEAHEHH